MLGLLRRKRHVRAGYMLYTEAVRAARTPSFYLGLGVPDTLDGRFDMVGLHVFLLIDRLRRAPDPGPAVAQAVFDAMFADMDQNLREMGVGDMTVGRKNKQMWEALHGRAQAYELALAAEDPGALMEALERNVWRGEAPPGAAARLAAQVVADRAALADLPLQAFADGSATFVGNRGGLGTEGAAA